MSEPARQDLAHVRETPVATDSAAIIQVIERAALNPDVDVEKMERLYAMAERASARQAEQAFNAALAEMQPKLPVIENRGETDKSKYAKWEDINDAIRPMLHEHGFALSFRVNRTEQMVSITGVLRHIGGHHDETTLDLPVDTSGSKNAVQAVGSSVSYGKRYTAIALLNITSRDPVDRDDDGERAGLRRSEVFQRAAADINACEGYEALIAWKRDKLAGIQKMVNANEYAELAALWNRRTRAAKEARQGKGAQ
jgi:hypothetical protein